MKSHTEVLIFHAGICDASAQILIDATPETAYADFKCTIPTQKRFRMEIKMEAKPNFKEMSTPKKLEYIWDYYKLPILCTVTAVIIAASLIHHYAVQKESVLDMIFVNGNDLYETPQILEPFFTSQGFDKKTQEISITTSLSFQLTDTGFLPDYYTTQALAAMFTVGNIDLFAAPPAVFDEYASVGFLADLHTLYSDEELAELEDFFVYAVSEKTGELFPCGLNLSDNKWIKESGYYSTDCYFGFTANGDDPAIASEFLSYLLSYQ